MYTQEQVNKMLFDDAKALSQICRNDIIPMPPQSDSAKRKEINLFLALNDSERAEMVKTADDIFYGANTAKEIVTLAKGAKTPILLAPIIMKAEAKAISDFILAKAAFWGETQAINPNYILNISTSATFSQEGSYDTGYLLAFNAVDGRGARQVYLEDLQYNLKYFRLNESEKVPVSGGASSQKTAIYPDRFGLGKLVSQWWEGVTFGSTTQEVNALVRMGSARGKSKVGYETLLRKPALAVNQWKMETLNADAISNIILNLNKKVQFMFNAARKASPPLFLAANTPILVYYHPDWAGTVKLIQNRSTANIVATTANPDLISLDYNILWVPTFEQALSGAWETTGTKDDEHFDILKEAGSKEFGVKIIIPKQSNHFVIFQDLFADANTLREEFMRNYVFEERYKPYLSPIQEGWLYTK